MRPAFVLCLFALLLAGCYGDYLGMGKRDTMATVEIVTDPPGAHIEVNQHYVGESPCTIQVWRRPNGVFREPCYIRALPVTEGFLQYRYFHGWPSEDVVPERIVFDMHTSPLAPQASLNRQ
jgi:hypothetical protein